jgi:signal transduction histidine kinase
VTDEGRGLPPAWSAGVGMQSMRTRAAELCGTCTVTSRPGGGTRVAAVLPLGCADTDASLDEDW